MSTDDFAPVEVPYVLFVVLLGLATLGAGVLVGLGVVALLP